MKRESVYLNERFMAAACIFAAMTGLIHCVLLQSEGLSFTRFIVFVKLITSVAVFLSFRHYKWDVVKGLMGGVLFSLMFQDAFLVLGKLWQEADFDKYLVVGIQGSIYLASAGMSFLMTIIITINHFVINYANHGNPESVEFSRMAVIFKFIVLDLLIISNSMLGFAPVVLWKNALMYLTDLAILALLVCIESQLDSFKILHEELIKQRREAKQTS